MNISAYSDAMGTVQDELGRRVRELRRRRGWTQEQLADASGRHSTYIGGVERGERNVTMQVAHDIASALGVSMEQLFRGVGRTGRKT